MKILIALSSRMLGEAVQSLLRDFDGSHEVALDWQKAGAGLDPDLVLLDHRRCTGEAFTRWPRAKFILIDTGLQPNEIAFLLLCHRIDGVISPEMDAAIFKKALEVVPQGQIWIDQKNVKALLRERKNVSRAGNLSGLNEKDRLIIDMVAQGFRNKQIADRLFLSEQTIKTHVSRIYRKLNVTNRSQLVSLVMKTRTLPAGNNH